MRDGRRQFATGVIIPSLDQHAYPPGGVAEVKRARRREKEAFLKSVFVTTARYVTNANANPVAPRRAADAGGDANAGAAVCYTAGGGAYDAGGPAEERPQPMCAPPGEQEAGEGLGHRSGGPGGGVVGKHKQATRGGLPRGTGFTGDGRAVAGRRQERESGNRKKQSGYGGGACAGGAMRAAAVDGTDCGGAAGGAAADLPVPSDEGEVASDVYATDARNSPLAKPMSATKKTEEEEALLAGGPGDNARRISSGTGRVPVAEGPGRARPQEEHATRGASGKRGRDGGREESPSRNSETPTTSGLAAATGSENARSPTGVQRRGRLGGALGEQGGSGGGAAAAEPEERESRVATPAPVVTSSVRVLDMGVMRSS